MTKPFTARRFGALGVAALLALTVVGCSNSDPGVDPEAPDGEAQVTITVTGKPSDDQPEELKVFNDRIEAFMDRHPDINVIGSDLNWDPQTFNAMLAGGTLPDLYVVYFTDSLSIIRNQQASDISTALETTGIAELLNDEVLGLVEGDGGGYYGIPFTAYGLGLVYNRDLFEQAGLDPDAPPATWDEVRAAAKQITDATGVPGFATMGEGGQGGWMLTAAAYSFGATVQAEDGTPELATPEVEGYLELLQKMRFEDGSMSDNVLYTQTSIGQALAAGQVAMFVGSPTSYGEAVTQFGMTPESFGMGAMPQHDGAHGTLTGGGVFMVSPNASEAQKEAIAVYVKEIYLDAAGLVEETAVEAARANAEQDLPVGLPGLSVFANSANAQLLEWIAPYINVPRDNFASYEASLESLPLLIEPAVNGQDLYALLGPVLQTVLTDPNADIAALLQAASDTFQSRLGR